MLKKIILGIILGLATGCSDQGPVSPTPETSNSAAKLTISQYEVAGRREVLEDLRVLFGLEPLGPIPYPANNPPVTERIALGRLLFFDPILGGEKDVSCGTCHHPDFAFADGRQFGAGSSGVGLGPDRQVSASAITGDPIDLEPRNPPTVFNVAFNADETGHPSATGFQLLDGRFRGLEEQATGPIRVRVEMRGDAYPEEVALDSLIARLRGIPAYVDLFTQAFPEEAALQDGATIIDSSTFARALAAYDRELVTRNSPYDQYVSGDEYALSPLQRKGLKLFFTKKLS
jgi:cytochrome c peroxidase